MIVIAAVSDAGNSLLSPASANGMVNCRPTTGLISRSEVISTLKDLCFLVAMLILAAVGAIVLYA